MDSGRRALNQHVKSGKTNGKKGRKIGCFENLDIYI